MKKLLLLLVPLVFFFGCDDEDENTNDDNNNLTYNCVDNDCFAEEGGQYATLDDCLSVCGDGGGCLNSMTIENNEYFFTSAAMEEVSCGGDLEFPFCKIAIYLMGAGISLEEFESSYIDPYTGEVIQNAYWDLVGQGHVVRWDVYVSQEYSSLAGAYEPAYDTLEVGIYSEDSAYAFNFDSNGGDATAFFVDGTLAITETLNGFYSITFNHQGSDGNSVTGCYDSIELIN